MEPGEVLRIPQLDRTGRAPLLGFHLACPACGRRRIELDEVAGAPPFVEGTPRVVEAVVETSTGQEQKVTFWAPSSLTSARTIRCGCGATVRAAGVEFVVA